MDDDEANETGMVLVEGYALSDIERKLIAFAQWVIQEHREECGDLDGGSIQDKLEELGLLKRVKVEEPCGEDCRCAEYYEKFPAECLRLVEGVKEGA